MAPGSSMDGGLLGSLASNGARSGPMGGGRFQGDYGGHQFHHQGPKTSLMEVFNRVSSAAAGGVMQSLIPGVMDMSRSLSKACSGYGSMEGLGGKGFSNGGSHYETGGSKGGAAGGLGGTRSWEAISEKEPSVGETSLSGNAVPVSTHEGGGHQGGHPGWGAPGQGHGGLQGGVHQGGRCSSGGSGPGGSHSGRLWAVFLVVLVYPEVVVVLGILVAGASMDNRVGQAIHCHREVEAFLVRLVVVFLGFLAVVVTWWRRSWCALWRASCMVGRDYGSTRIGEGSRTSVVAGAL